MIPMMLQGGLPVKGIRMHPMENILERALDWLAAGREVAFATVIAAQGSSPRPVGSQLLIDEDGNFEGSISGGCIEGAVVSEGMEVIALGKARRLVFGATTDGVWDVGLACGGEVEIFIEPLAAHLEMLVKLASLRKARQPSCLITDLASGEKTLITSGTETHELPPILRAAVKEVLASENSDVCMLGDKCFFLHACFPDPELVIIGAVHITQPLTLMAQTAGYTVTIIDPREAFATRDRFPDVTLVNAWPNEALVLQLLHPQSAVVVLSHEPKIDDPALKIALRSQAFYIGALGSRKTHAQRIERLMQAGLLPNEIDRLHAPVGLDIGARNAPEIAIAVMAEITQCRRHRAHLTVRAFG